MSLRNETMPALSDDVVPPLVCGVADLTSFAYQHNSFDRVVERIGNPPDEAALLFDMAIAFQLDFRRQEGLALQRAALERTVVFRLLPQGQRRHRLRVLAVMGAGDLMVNTPLDFMTRDLDIRLDLLHVLPDRKLPAVIPDHDVAFFAHGDPDPGLLARLKAMYDAWPRPVLNNPGFLPLLARDVLSRKLADVPSIRSPAACAATRAALEALVRHGTMPPGFEAAAGPYPCLVRPYGSHAGSGLALAHGPADLASYLRSSSAETFYLTAFEDYAGADGYYRKSRVAFIDCAPFLCHMAVSRHWMVHYLNAGMTDSAAKRDEEAQAMAEFDSGFARRHADAFQALHERLGFDYYSIDCAETRDGRLLVFEADPAAIVHLMDPEDLFPYKAPQMRRVFKAFGSMLHRAAAKRPVMMVGSGRIAGGGSHDHGILRPAGA